MSSDIDDLLGEEPTPRKFGGRLPGSKNKPKPDVPPKAADGKSLIDASVTQALMRPVSISFLCDIWGMDRSTVIKRLAPLPPVSSHRGNTPLYNFRQAAQYLVSPKVDVAEFIRNMGLNDLPMSLQKDVWDAKLKQQKWAVNAGELWKTTDVVEVLGDTFQRIKTTTQLWVEQIAEDGEVPETVRETLMGLVDGLNRDIYESLVVMVKERKTPAQIAEIEGSELDG